MLLNKWIVLKIVLQRHLGKIMFNFFTVLFGGLLYGSKQTYEQGKLNAYEDSTSNNQITYSRLKATIGATPATEELLKNYVLSGEHYKKICNDFQEDFRFVFGGNWKSRLCIPPINSVSKYDFQLPMNHVYWVYRLLLASQGKVDSSMLTMGYTIGGIHEKDMCVRFAQRIEQQLQEHTEQHIRFVVGKNTTDDICGCNIKIDVLCNQPFYRIW